MKRVLVLVAIAAVGLMALTGASAGEQQFRGTVYLGMDTPLTGPTAIVGQGDREAVLKLVRYWNNRGGINGRRVVVDILDNASNPSQAVQNVQRFVGDSKYVAILGSGNAGGAIATAPLATAGRIPFLALSPPTPLVAPARPYVYVALPTARLYAYSMAQYLKSLGVTRIALMGDNGAFGRDGVGQVKALAESVRVHDHGRRDLLADDDELRGRAGQGAELERAGALDVDGDSRRQHDRQGVPAAATPAASRPDGRESVAAVPRGDVPGRERSAREQLPRPRVGPASGG